MELKFIVSICRQVMYRNVIWPRLILPVVSTLFAVGCGSGTGGAKEYTGELAQAAGTVTLDGQPISEAMIAFLPADGRVPEGFSGATGVSDSQGKFQVRTGEKLGVPPGRYRVIVERWATADGQPFKEDLENGIDLIQAQMSGQLKQLIPEQYTDPRRTPMTVTVTKNHSDAVDLPLRSK